MNKTIKLLEEIAVDATLINNEAIQEKILSADISEEVKSALVEKDFEEVVKFLDARSKIFCGIFPAEDDEPSEDDDSEDDDNEQPTESRVVVNG